MLDALKLILMTHYGGHTYVELGVHCTALGDLWQKKHKNIFRMREPTKMRRGESSEGPGNCLNCHLIQMGRFV